MALVAMLAIMPAPVSLADAIASTRANWTGKGKPPLWVKAHLEAGGVKDDLLIDGKGRQEVLLTAATNDLD